MLETHYKGHKRLDFKLCGYTGSIIVPKTPEIGRPWIWRAEFLGDFDQADMELVKKGWHLAYYKISDMYGCPRSVELMVAFQNYVIREYGLSCKTVIFGFSRGGLYAVNYAVQYPEKVECLYLDAPVINMQSWPKAHSSAKNWADCLRWYGFNESDALEYNRIQLDRAQVLAENKIPILIVAGDADQVVPFEENSEPFANKYLETYDDIRIIIKKGCAHHPHSLKDTTPIISFISDFYTARNITD